MTAVLSIRRVPSKSSSSAPQPLFRCVASARRTGRISFGNQQSAITNQKYRVQGRDVGGVVTYHEDLARSASDAAAMGCEEEVGDGEQRPWGLGS